MKKLTLISILFAFCLLANAQDLPRIVPPSPQSRLLGMYTDFPVDLNYGLPDITIPLYNIKIDEMEIPITLKYHASGIKTGQDDGNVGLGWILCTDYRISRTIYGLADSKEIEMPSYNVLSNNIYNLNPDALENYLSRFHYKSPASVDSDPSMPTRSGGALDGEYDHFNYNLPLQSGKFILINRSLFSSANALEITPKKNRIKLLEGSSSVNSARGIIGFSITDDNNNIFNFGEYQEKLGSKVLETNMNLNIKDVTAWALTNIKTKKGDDIKFTYANSTSTTKYTPSYSLTLQQPRINTQFLERWIYQENTEYNNSTYSIFSLEKIVTKSEKVNIVVLPNNSNKISYIDIIDSLTGNLIKKIKFHYSEKYVFPTNYTFLDSVQIFGSNTNQYETYRFNYFHKEMDFTSTYLIPDQWGYNKFSSSPNGLLHRELGNDYGNTEGTSNLPSFIGNNTIYHRYKTYIFSDRKSNEDPRVFTLKSIQYPTGGITLFDFEPNKILYGNSSVYSGGIRVKSIFKYLSNSDFYTNDPHIKKFYTYGQNENGNGEVFKLLNENDFRKESLIPMYNALPIRTVYYSSSQLSEGYEKTSYPFVTERLLRTGGYNGKVVYNYRNLPNFSYNSFPPSYENTSPSEFHSYSVGPSYISEYNEWITPKLISKKYFNNNDTLLKIEKFKYKFVDRYDYGGLKVRPFVKANRDDTYSPHLSPHPFSSFYSYGLYFINSGKELLDEYEEISYHGGDSILNKINYDYNEFYQLNKEITLNSKGKSIEKNIYYPVDFPDSLISGAMMYNNDLNYKLEESLKVNGVLNKYIQNEYFNSNNLFLLNKVKVMNFPDQIIEEKLKFHNYDNKGNILSVSKNNGVKYNYIWSYDGEFPIAEIVNADYAIIESVLGGESVVSSFNKQNPTDAEIFSFIIKLRNSPLLKDAQITSYTYQPLVGMKSKTDARGVTEYYEYDGMQRLKAVLDQVKNVTSSMDYHYRPN